MFVPLDIFSVTHYFLYLPIESGVYFRISGSAVNETNLNRKTKAWE